MTIRFRLYLALGLMSLTVIIIGLISGLALIKTNDSIRTIVADRVVPLEQLKSISDHYAVDIVDMSHKVRSGALTWAQARENLDEALARIDEKWRAYTSTFLTSEEAALVEETEAATKVAQSAIDELRAIFKREDGDALVAFINGKLYQVIDPIGEPVGSLVNLQLSVAQKEAMSANQTSNFSITLIQIIGVLALGLIGFSFHTVARKVLKPLKELEDSMCGLARGNMDTEVPFAGRSDEIGAMAGSVQVFKENGLERLKLERDQAGEQAAREKRARKVDTLINGFAEELEAILANVSKASEDLHMTANSLNETAEKSSANASDVAATASQTTNNVQTVASASDELSVSIREVSERVSSAMRIAGEAKELTSTTDKTVQGLVTAAQKIGTVSSLISDIAEQTNLLALNATIEAARAGEAGKGFAVVATEVKGLASQTANATDEIQTQIQQIQAVSSEAATAIRSVGEIVSRINETAVAAAAAVEEQGAATNEIARNVTEAAEGTSNVSTRITEVSAGFAVTETRAGELLGAAGNLADNSTRLKSLVDRFFEEIRAA
ncbi:methyl-accepting chemotaxis protein [Stappia sediminis]|nr:methyl-accepting chemotaxis protein [Stappia sediminis]